MMRIRKVSLLLVLLLLSFGFVRCQDGGSGTGSSAGCGQLSNLQLGNFAGSDGDSLGSSQFSAPVDLPVTIAKNDALDSVNPGSIRFTPSSQNAVSVPLASTSDIYGTFTFKTNAEACLTVGVFSNGEYVTSITGDASNGCLFSYSITSDQVNETFTFMVLYDGIVTGGTGSNPVSVELVQSSLTDGAVIQVFISYNYPTLTDIDYANTVQTMSPFFLKDAAGSKLVGTIVKNSSNEYFAWAMKNGGGDPKFISADLGETATTVANSIRPYFLVTGSSFDSVYRFDENFDFASLINTNSSNVGLDSVNIDMTDGTTIGAHIGGSYFIYESQTNNVRELYLYDFNLENDQVIKTVNDTVATLETGFISQGTYSVIYSLPGQSALALTRLIGTVSDENLEDNLSSENYIQVNQSSLKVVAGAAPTVNAAGVVVFSCESESQDALCAVVDGTDDASVLKVLGYPITRMSISGDGSRFVAYEVATTPSPTICVYDLINDVDLGCPAVGQYPVPSPFNLNEIVYIANLGDTKQLALISLDITVTPEDLVLDGDDSEFFEGGRITTDAYGGVPPYSFSVVAGEGEVDSDIGIVYSTGNAGTITVKVTDSLGATSEMDFEVAAGEGGGGGGDSCNFGIQAMNTTYTTPSQIIPTNLGAAPSVNYDSTDPISFVLDFTDNVDPATVLKNAFQICLLQDGTSIPESCLEQNIGDPGYSVTASDADTITVTVTGNQLTTLNRTYVVQVNSTTDINNTDGDPLCGGAVQQYYITLVP